MSTQSPIPKHLRNGRRAFRATVLTGVMVAILVMVFFPTLVEMTVYWEGDQYSHGFLVPLFAMILLWLRRIHGEEAGFAENRQEKGILGVSLGLCALAAALAWGADLPVVGSIRETLGPWLPPAIAGVFCFGILILGLSALYRWQMTAEVSESKAWPQWLGVILLVFGLVFWIFCTRNGYDVPSIYAFLPSLLGVVLISVGWRTSRWLAPALLFLAFMFPLPWTVEQRLLGPLQGLARDAATYLMQTLGVSAYSVGGNTILVNGQAMDVVEQCSGLRMTTIFLALSVAFIFVVRRPWWQSLMILLSAIPIALAVNITRITVTGIAYSMQLSHETMTLVHDWAGIMMIFLALILLWLLVTAMDALFQEEDEQQLATAA